LLTTIRKIALKFKGFTKCFLQTFFENFSQFLSDPAKIIFTSKFRYLLFLQKSETGTANMWATTNSKPAEPIIMMGQSESLSNRQVLFITLFSKSSHSSLVAAPFTSERANTGIVL
jgi:hypothetical protein